LLTNLANHVQPLIRYDLGDRIMVHEARCGCGSFLPVIELQGRDDDTLWLGSRRKRSRAPRARPRMRSASGPSIPVVRSKVLALCCSNRKSKRPFSSSRTVLSARGRMPTARRRDPRVRADTSARGDCWQQPTLVAREAHWPLQCRWARGGVHVVTAGGDRTRC